MQLQLARLGGRRKVKCDRLARHLPLAHVCDLGERRHRAHAHADPPARCLIHDHLAADVHGLQEARPREHVNAVQRSCFPQPTVPCRLHQRRVVSHAIGEHGARQLTTGLCAMQRSRRQRDVQHPHLTELDHVRHARGDKATGVVVDPRQMRRLSAVLLQLQQRTEHV